VNYQANFCIAAHFPRIFSKSHQVAPVFSRRRLNANFVLFPVLVTAKVFAYTGCDIFRCISGHLTHRYTLKGQLKLLTVLAGVRSKTSHAALQQHGRHCVIVTDGTAC
jgi:hypothetical protein